MIVDRKKKKLPYTNFLAEYYFSINNCTGIIDQGQKVSKSDQY